MRFPKCSFGDGFVWFGPERVYWLDEPLHRILHCNDLDGNALWQLDGYDGINMLAVDGDVEGVSLDWPDNTHILECLDPNGNLVGHAGRHSTFLRSPQVDGLGHVFAWGHVSAPHIYKMETGENFLGGLLETNEHPFSAGKDSCLYVMTYADGGRFQVTKVRNGIDFSSATLTRGRELSGNSENLYISDGGRWNLAPGPIFSTSMNPISVELVHHAPTDNPTSMNVIVESRGSVNGVEQKVSAYNFATSTWTDLETNALLPADSDRYIVLPIANPEDYIDANRQIRIRLEYRKDTPAFVWPWQVGIDREMVQYAR